MFHFENAYHIPNSYVLAYSCKTNLPSNTAFRGFGGPQGMFAGEHIIRHVAETLGKDVTEISNLFNAIFILGRIVCLKSSFYLFQLRRICTKQITLRIIISCLQTSQLIGMFKTKQNL